MANTRDIIPLFLSLLLFHDLMTCFLICELFASWCFIQPFTLCWQHLTFFLFLLQSVTCCVNILLFFSFIRAALVSFFMVPTRTALDWHQKKRQRKWKSGPGWKNGVYHRTFHFVLVFSFLFFFLWGISRQEKVYITYYSLFKLILRKDKPRGFCTIESWSASCF